MFALVFYYLPTIICLLLVAKEAYQSHQADPAYFGDSKNVVQVTLTVIASFIPLINIGMLVYFIIQETKK